MSLSHTDDLPKKHSSFVTVVALASGDCSRQDSESNTDIAMDVHSHE